MFKFYTIPSVDIIDKLIGEQATIKLSSAFNLNDPYELKFNLDIDPLADGHEKEFYRNNPDSNPHGFEDWKKHAIEHDGYTWYIEQQLRSSVALNIALCSFTNKNNNNLMWSHYASNHKGICIEYKPQLFEYLRTLNDFLAYGIVNYSDEPAIVKSLDNEKLKILKILFNKQSEWNYESEFRVVFYSEKDTEFIPIDTKFIKAIYIGSRADTEIKNKILSVCNNIDIEIYWGITLGETYNVQFEKHKDGRIYTSAFWR